MKTFGLVVLTQLTGSERQRIALARVILKNAPVIVLDEATALSVHAENTRLQFVRIYSGIF